MAKRRKSRTPRRTSRKALKKRQRAIALVAFASFVALVAIASILLRHPSHTPPRRPVHEAARSAPRPSSIHPIESAPAVAESFRSAIERAGGADVWVRRAHAAGEAFDVVVAARRSAEVERAVAAVARADGLALRRFDSPPSAPGTAASSFTAYGANRALCRWTVREMRVIPRVSIVIDDLGQSASAARSLLRLRAPLTFSVMPHLADSRATAEEAHRNGVEVMLHLPMQPIDDAAPDVSPGEIKTGMGPAEVQNIVSSALASVPYAAGVNNHMGSRATTDPRLMTEVMAALAPRHLYYIDSRTIANSVALDAARRAGIPAFYRAVFLDDTRTVPYTLGQLRALCRIADRQGAALAIGHPYPSTIAALAQFLPALEREDVQLVRVSSLLRLPEVARLDAGAGHRLAASN